MSDSLTSFLQRTRAAWGPLTTEIVEEVRAGLEQLTQAPPAEPWLKALHDELPASAELYRDSVQGFLLLAHSEPTGLYRPPHDHGRSWVAYALQQGEMVISTYARVADPDGGVRLVRRETSRLRPGEVRVYLPGDIHDTACSRGPSLLFRFTERDLKKEDKIERRLTRYVERDGIWTTGTV